MATSGRAAAGLARVFRRPGFVAIALLVYIGAIILLSVWPQWELWLATLTAPGTTIASAGALVWALVATIGGQSGGLGVWLIHATCALVGVQIALLVFYIRHRQQRTTAGQRAGAAGLGGVVAGVFGVGCAACGSVIATGLLGLFGGAGVLAWLPLQGQEFSWLSVGLLAWAVWYLARHINDPAVCPS